MMTCPNGHASQATDYCDTCGEPLAPAPAQAPAASAASGAASSAAAGPSACPHCGAPAAPGALFCENCGYDFTTGTEAAPFVSPASQSLLSVPGSALPPGAPAGEGESGELAGPAEAAAEPPAADPAAADPAAHEGEPRGGTDAAPSPVPPAQVPARRWVAEIWVDPEWYAEQQPEDPIPSAGAPNLVVLSESGALVGRASRSRGIDPQIECGSDNGVSRRHCQLSTDGFRWWVEDLGSANGTFLSAVGEPLPLRPITPGERVEVEEGMRLFLGGWTRIVLRPALAGEV